MPLTSPDSISYPASTYTSGFVAALAAMATSIQTALSLRQNHDFVWANAAARAAQAGMLTGDKGYQTDTAIVYRYSGSAWKEWESDYITWTTAPTNLTVGTGGSAEATQKYKWIAGRLWFTYRYVIGTSGASMGTAPTINFPISVALVITGGALATGDGAIRDVSVPSTPAYVRVNVSSATTGVLQTYTGTTASITATAPMTWAAGDILAGGFWADPA